jgi:hypothetical protein
MARFLTTLPANSGYYNLGSVEAFPTGGTGPVAYGPTSYLGSDPLPSRTGDSINTAQDLGDFSNVFRSLTLTSTHGGNTRIQSTFYKLTLTKPRALLLTQNYSPTSYQSNTNRNTLVSFYKVEDGTHRRELPINDDGYVYKQTGLTEEDSYDSGTSYLHDYPSEQLDPGTYIMLITNDIRYLTTTYSISIFSVNGDWGYIDEAPSELIEFGLVSEGASATLDFGDLTATKKTSGYPYASTSGLGYTRAGVSP